MLAPCLLENGCPNSLKSCMCVPDLPPDKMKRRRLSIAVRAIFFGDKAVLGLHTFLKVQMWGFYLFIYFCLEFLFLCFKAKKKKKNRGFSVVFCFPPEMGSDFRRNIVLKTFEKNLFFFFFFFLLLL